MFSSLLHTFLARTSLNNLSWKSGTSLVVCVCFFAVLWHVSSSPLPCWQHPILRILLSRRSCFFLASEHARHCPPAGEDFPRPFFSCRLFNQNSFGTSSSPSIALCNVQIYFGRRLRKGNKCAIDTDIFCQGKFAGSMHYMQMTDVLFFYSHRD